MPLLINFDLKSSNRGDTLKDIITCIKKKAAEQRDTNRITPAKEAKVNKYWKHNTIKNYK